MKLFARVLSVLGVVMAIRRYIASRPGAEGGAPADVPDFDPVEEASKASFPASDPPQSW